MVGFNNIALWSTTISSLAHLTTAAPPGEMKRNILSGIEVARKVRNLLKPRLADVATIPRFNRYVALGDSYSAGPGPIEGSLPGTGGPNNKQCYRTTGAWPFQLQEALDVTQFQFSACTGLDSVGIRTTQIEAENSRFVGDDGTKPDLVLLTSGGNDMNSFANVVKTCPYFVNHLAGQTCDGAISAAEDLVGGGGRAATVGRINETVNAIVAASAPNAKIILMGYPDLYADDTLIGGDCWLVRSRRQRINGVVDGFQQILADVASWHNNLRPTYTVLLVNPNNGAQAGDMSFDGHRFCEDAHCIAARTTTSATYKITLLLARLPGKLSSLDSFIPPHMDIKS